MNEWLVTYVRYGLRKETVHADTLENALEIFRRDHPELPGIALESIVCVK